MLIEDFEWLIDLHYCSFCCNKAQGDGCAAVTPAEHHHPVATPGNSQECIICPTCDISSSVSQPASQTPNHFLLRHRLIITAFSCSNSRSSSMKRSAAAVLSSPNPHPDMRSASLCCICAPTTRTLLLKMEYSQSISHCCCSSYSSYPFCCCSCSSSQPVSQAHQPSHLQSEHSPSSPGVVMWISARHLSWINMLHPLRSFYSTME